MNSINKDREIEKYWFYSNCFDHLRLPLLVKEEWAKDCVSICDFDPVILNCLQPLSEWVDNVEKTFSYEVKSNPLYQRLLEESRNSGTIRAVKSGYEPKLRRKLFFEVLNALKQQTSETVARAFENWIQVIFFTPDFRNVLRAWWLVFLRLRPFRGSSAAEYERWVQKKVEPPEHLKNIAPEIEAILKQFEIVDEMRRNAPRVPAQPWETDVKEWPCMESLWLSRSTGAIIRFQALQLIANRFTEDEIQMIVDWAELQKTRLRNSNHFNLKGTKYICQTFPRFEGISVFDIPEDELNSYITEYLGNYL
ncbi:MAG: hypothetical protein AAGG51_22165 [Cyanobacteria bacterium P01_G01_bin.54]